MALYIDGVDDEGAYSGTGGSLTYSSSSSLIGMKHNFEYSFDGRIDDVRFYDRALTAREVWQLHQNGLN